MRFKYCRRERLEDYAMDSLYGVNMRSIKSLERAWHRNGSSRLTADRNWPRGLYSGGRGRYG